jgi:drug/metabolite transporter (DMT)-like permease
MTSGAITIQKRSRLSRGERQDRVHGYDYLLLLILAMIWGSSFLLQKIVVAEVPPVTLTAMRQLIGAGVMVGVLVFAGSRLNASPWEHFLMFLSGILGTVLPFSLIATGLETLDSGLAAILMGAMPLVTIVLAHFTTPDEKMNRNKLLAVGLGMAGLVVLFWPSLVRGFGTDLLAQLIVFSAAICYALNSLVTKKLIHLDAPMLLAIIIFWSAAILLPMSILIEPGAMTLPSGASLAAIVTLAVFPTVVAAFLMYELIARQGAGFFGQINLLVPVCGVFLGFVFLGERLGWNAWSALAFILMGVTVSRNWNSSALQATPQPKHETQESKQ